jgi:hypothetical protein
VASNRSVASPSAIDCICCALGGAILLWIATIAVSAKQTEGIQSLILVTFKLTYEAATPGNASNSQVHPDEAWQLNGEDLVQFYQDGKVEPNWGGWDGLTKTSTSDGTCSFAPNEEGIELVSFSSVFDSSSRVGKRSVLIQNSDKLASGILSIDWSKVYKPISIEVRVVANDAETQHLHLDEDRIKSEFKKGLEIYAKPGELMAESIRE